MKTILVKDRDGKAIGGVMVEGNIRKSILMVFAFYDDFDADKSGELSTAESAFQILGGTFEFPVFALLRGKALQEVYFCARRMPELGSQSEFIRGFQSNFKAWSKQTLSHGLYHATFGALLGKSLNKLFAEEWVGDAISSEIVSFAVQIGAEETAEQLVLSALRK